MSAGRIAIVATVVALIVLLILLARGPAGRQDRVTGNPRGFANHSYAVTT